MEIESSPVIDSNTSAVIVGSDVNEAGGSGVGKPGVQAFDATTGLFRWKFQPEDLTNPTDLNSSRSDGCGSVWGSPALDITSVAAGTHGLVFFGTGNCKFPYSQTGSELKWEGAWAIDATNGHLVWNLQEPPNDYNNKDNSNRADDDIGSSPIVAHPNASLNLAIFASKTGYAYGLDEATGAKLWQVQAAQPGNLGQGVAAIGGFIGSGALGVSNGIPAVFLTSAVFTPFSSDGVQPQVPPLTPDASIANDPLRLASVHAISAVDGTELWHAALSTPTYAAATYGSGVVFAPSTTGFAAEAYSADTGVQVWRFPTSAPESSGVSIAGSDVFFGSGTDFAAPSCGVWALTTGLPAGGQLPAATLGRR
jgi:outer membrane protein assembly factor BamB